MLDQKGHANQSEMLHAERSCQKQEFAGASTIYQPQ
jgi:hypothetical protein